MKRFWIGLLLLQLLGMCHAQTMVPWNLISQTAKSELQYAWGRERWTRCPTLRLKGGASHACQE